MRVRVRSLLGQGRVRGGVRVRVRQGVRNPEARNLMKEMKVGDKVRLPFVNCPEKCQLASGFVLTRVAISQVRACSGPDANPLPAFRARAGAGGSWQWPSITKMDDDKVATRPEWGRPDFLGCSESVRLEQVNISVAQVRLEDYRLSVIN